MDCRVERFGESIEEWEGRRREWIRKWITGLRVVGKGREGDNVERGIWLEEVSSRINSCSWKKVRCRRSEGAAEAGQK